MTVSGPLEPLPEGTAAKAPPAWAVTSRFSPTPLIETWRLAFGQPSLIIVRTSSAATSGSFRAGSLGRVGDDGKGLVLFDVCRAPAQAMTVVSPYWAVQPVGP